MDPYSEERLTEEVLHLHSLWHRGPPRNPKPTHNHSSTAVANPNPSNKRSIDPNKRKNKKKKKKPRPDPPQDSAPEWPCPEPVRNQPSTSSGWPPIQPVATPAAQLVSFEERENFAALQLQYKGSDACRGFFAKNADSGSDEEGEGEEEEEEDDREMMESEEYKFFLKMFVENEELRVYYEKNCESGLFCCLVCGGMGKKKFGKRFKNCLGLVQHSISISGTKKKRAHRAFGQVVCRVFGWDFDRLPTIVLKGEPLSQSLANSGDLKVQSEEIHADNKNEVVSVNVNEDEQKLEEVKTAEDPTSNSKDLISGENDDACKDNDVKLQVENADNSISGMGESNGEMPVTILRACKEFHATFFKSMNDDDVSEKDLTDGAEEREEFKFFLKLFTENESLRRYYENHYGDGEFTCLACEVAGRRIKCFKTCSRLLQHSTHLGKNNIQKRGQKPQKTKVLKTGMLAHRAYTLVVCKVLGCDIKMLPAIILKGEALGHSLTKLDMSKYKSVGKMQSSNINGIAEDDSTKVNELQGVKLPDSMKVYNDGEVTLMDDALDCVK